MRGVAALIAAMALAAPARAAVVPAPGAHDPRMRVVAYDAGNVTRLLCAPGRSTSIELGAGEVVDTIAVGDDKAWVVAPAGNRVFVTPNDATGPPKVSNMQVVSRKADGATRLYQFDLVPVDPGAAMAGLRVVYPDDIRAERAAAAAKAREAAAARKARDRLAIDYAYGPRNWRFVARGAAAIEPTEISDDGQSTVLRFAGMHYPAIYLGACGDSEAIAPISVRDDLILVQTTAPLFCLRRGDAALEIRNLGYDPVGVHPRTGTTSPDVVRVIKGQRR
jgi:type IV secretion system protein VirB9